MQSKTFLYILLSVLFVSVFFVFIILTDNYPIQTPVEETFFQVLWNKTSSVAGA